MGSLKFVSFSPRPLLKDLFPPLFSNQRTKNSGRDQGLGSSPPTAPSLSPSSPPRLPNLMTIIEILSYPLWTWFLHWQMDMGALMMPAWLYMFGRIGQSQRWERTLTRPGLSPSLPPSTGESWVSLTRPLQPGGKRSPGLLPSCSVPLGAPPSPAHDQPMTLPAVWLKPELSC